MVSNPATPNADMSRLMRATALSIPRPAGDESSGMKGEPTDATPYAVPCRASRTERQNARLSRAGHEGVQEPYSPALMFCSNRASVVSNWVKNAVYAPSAPVTVSRGLSPRLAPEVESWRPLRVATRTIGTVRRTERRLVTPSSAVMG